MADIYGAQVRVSDDAVIGLWNGDSSVGYPANTAEYYVFQLSEAEFGTLGSNPLFWGYDETRPRWKIVSNALVEQVDTRRLVVFTPNTVVVVRQNNATTPVAVEVRRAPPNESQIDTGINGNFNVMVDAKGPGVSAFWLSVTIASGVGQILIDREIVKEARIRDQGVFRVDTPLQVRVLADNRF